MPGLLAFLCVVGQIATYELRSAHAATTAQRGIAAYYSPGTMARVARNRGIALREDVDGYASLTHCSHIGKIVTASIAVRRRHDATSPSGALGAQRLQSPVPCSPQ